MNIEKLYDIFKTCSSVCTDSRDCPPNSLFFALHGPTFDGNFFAKEALAKGCSWAVVDKKEFANHPKCILVEDSLHAMQSLATYLRNKISPKVIAITGTNGKTTTKELVATTLSKQYNVLSTEGNFNNEIGVAKTLLRLNSAHEIAVIEMGASKKGDISSLCEIADPDYGMITNIGKAHLQGFGSLEGVVKTKGELYDFLKKKKQGHIFVNADCQQLVAMTEGFLHVDYYSTKGKKSVNVMGEILCCDPFLSFRWRKTGDNRAWHNVQTNLIGAYNLQNFIATTAIACHFGIESKDICEAFRNYIPLNGRSQMLVSGSNKIIIDAYNANPTSMIAAIENFKTIHAERKMAIIGEMKELGEASYNEHIKIVKDLEYSGFDDVWLVGNAFNEIQCDFHKFANVEEVKSHLRSIMPQNTCILIKGSHSTHLYEMINEFQNE